MELFHGSNVVVNHSKVMVNVFYEDFVEGMIRVYNDNIWEIIGNYNCSAYYEPSYVI